MKLLQYSGNTLHYPPRVVGYGVCCRDESKLQFLLTWQFVFVGVSTDCDGLVRHSIDGLVQNCSNFSALAMKLLPSCATPGRDVHCVLFYCIANLFFQRVVQCLNTVNKYAQCKICVFFKHTKNSMNTEMLFLIFFSFRYTPGVWITTRFLC